MAFDPNKVTYFAKTDARGKNVQFGIKAKDRQRHVYVIGKTGMGKSTLLENMAVQDIQNGEGMAFIDPHGSAAENLLNYIPEHRIKDVLYFAPHDTDFPVSFNVMEDVGPDKRHLVVSGLMSVFKKIFVDQWSARMEYILSNTLLALLEYPDATLLGVNRMLSDKDYRKLVVDNVKDPGVKAFWVDEFAKYNERYMQEAGDAIKNKIGQFTANPIIRNIIGQPKSSFDIRTIMDEKKILIMNLSKGLIGETNATLLGSMLTTRIYLAAMSRADLPPEKMRDMPNFYFYVDEFQSFANASFANILSEARKYHLNLTIAHQYIDQMEEEIRNAVFGNVGTTIAFRVGPFDAEVLETVFTPQFLAPDIINLSFAQIYLTLMIDGIGSQPFSATTLPPIEPPVTSCKQMAIASSRELFSHGRAEVEELIRKFHEPVIVPKKADRVEREKSDSAPVVPRKFEPERRRSNDEAPRRASDRTPVRTEAVARSPQNQDARKEVVPEVVREAPVSTPPKVVVQSVSIQVSEEVKTEIPETITEPAVIPSQKTERPRQEYVKKESQSEGLRSALKRISDTSNKSGNVEPNHQKKHEGANRAELKSLLSSVLAQVHVPTVEPKPEQAPESKKEEVKTPASTPEVKQAPSPEVSPKATQTEPSPKVAEQNTSHSNMPTPKELERMMRITTNDKSPLQ